MNDFDYEVKQKKDIARSAAHRVCGSKSSKCDLPSDHLTEAQKRALNGPVESVNLKEPMNWAAFKALPESLQAEYIRYLKAEYQASDAMMGKMFGVSDASVNIKRNQLGVPSSGKGQQPTKAVKAAWAEFIGDTAVTPEQTETAAEEPTPTAVELVVPESNAVRITPLQSFNAEFRDIRSWEEFYALIKPFPAPRPGSTISIRVFLGGD